MGEKYYQSARKFGETLFNEGFREDLRAQYQPWVNQMKHAIGLIEPPSSSSKTSLRDSKKGKGRGRKSSSSSSSSSSSKGSKRATIPSRPLAKSTRTGSGSESGIGLESEAGLGLGSAHKSTIGGGLKKNKRISGLKLKHPKRSKLPPQQQGLTKGSKSVREKAGGQGGGRVGGTSSAEGESIEEEEQEEIEMDYFPLDAMVFFGDLNYRLDVPRLEV